MIGFKKVKIQVATRKGKYALVTNGLLLGFGRWYICVGGMPAVSAKVMRWLETGTTERIWQ